MKKKATTRKGKATSRQPSLNFAASPKAEMIVEAPCVSSSTTPSVPAERDPIPRAKKHSAAALANGSPNTSSRGEAKDGGWRMVALQEVGRIVTGSTPPKARTDFYGGSFPFVKPGELLHCMVSESVDHLSDAGSEVADVAPAGGVLVSCIGNLGKTGLAARPVAFNQQINAIIPHVPDHSKWIFYAVQTPDFASQISAVSSATTIAIVNKGKFSTLRIPLAPLPEQRRIVAEIEKQLTRLDAGVAALKRVQANLKRYRAAVLKAACEGKLVPTEAELARQEGRTYETGEQLLQCILTERRQNWQGRGQYKEPEAPETKNLAPVPDAWKWATVEQVATLVQYGSSAKTNDDSSGVPVLRMGNIQDGKIEFDKLKYLPTSHDEFPELLLAPGDLLFNRTNSAELVGKTAVFRNARPPCSFASYLIRVRFSDGCIPEFVSYFINSVFGRAWIADVVSQQVGQANVNGTKLQALPMPVPPFAEQTRIVAEVERHLSVVEELDAVVSANLQRAARLRQSILQKAFTGKLNT